MFSLFKKGHNYVGMYKCIEEGREKTKRERERVGGGAVSPVSSVN